LISWFYFRVRWSS